MKTYENCKYELKKQFDLQKLWESSELIVYDMRLTILRNIY